MIPADRVTSLAHVTSAYVYSCCVHGVVVHIIEIDGKHSSVPVKETTVALQLDPEEYRKTVLKYAYRSLK